MSQPLELPALNGLDPLGFLAALGVLRLLHDEAGMPARLSFDDRTATARLHSPLTSLEALTTTLVKVIDSVPADGVIPGVAAEFPTGKNGIGTDPMRVPRTTYRQHTDRILGPQPTPIQQSWLACLITDLAADSDGRAALSLFTAPTGQQSLRSAFHKPITQVRKAPAARIHEALFKWQRIEGYTGENLDHRASRGAADHPSGQGGSAGVPGATWLALMALPVLRLTGDTTRPKGTLWHRPGRRRPIMTWPVWRQALDLFAVRTLLEHPALAPVDTNGTITVSSAGWEPLGVFAVAGATRTAPDGSKSAGFLTPITIDTR